ncbi:hypothetical protein [Marinobacter sp.]|uniref:hypothetical protein n=1 Tax=Marinobacter sp. TaxID=50741 RepID=UPI0034A4134A
MEPNDPSTNQGRGTPPPSQSPPLSGTSSQQAGRPGGEGSSQPGSKPDSTEKSAGDLGSEAKKAAKARASEGADTAKKTASSTVSHGAEALGRAADSLRDQGEESLAQAVSSIASGLSEYAERLEKRTAEDLVQDLVRLARNNPTLFVLGSVGLGIALSRFFKASSRSSDS